VLLKFILISLINQFWFLTGGHKEIIKEKRGIFWGKSSFAINPECLCCAEWKDNIKTLPQLEVDSIIKIAHKDEELIGICKWIGLINGVESVGIEMVYKTVILMYFKIWIG